MQLTIDVYFYGELAQHIGMNQLELPIVQSVTVADVKNALATHFDNWQQFIKPIYNVVNRHLVEDNHLVNAGDVLAFFDEKPIV